MMEFLKLREKHCISNPKFKYLGCNTITNIDIDDKGAYYESTL